MNLLKAKAKIFRSRESLSNQVAGWKESGQTVVFTNGCFDILHPGHMAYLAQTADEGQKLIIGVNTDKSVSDLKGPHRPIQNEESRLLLLSSLFFVDAVILFDEPTPLELIAEVKPDVLAKGGDYTIDTIVGAKEVLAWGGRVEVIPFLEGHSTSAIESKIKKA